MPRKQQLLTLEHLRAFKALGRQEAAGEDAKVVVKFFCPWNQWRWYATEFDHETLNFFGLVSGDVSELGEFSLDELARSTGPLGLSIERDAHFPVAQHSLRDVREGRVS